jgi:hypothetical protein
MTNKSNKSNVKTVGSMNQTQTLVREAKNLRVKTNIKSGVKANQKW